MGPIKVVIGTFIFFILKEFSKADPSIFAPIIFPAIKSSLAASKEKGTFTSIFPDKAFMFHSLLLPRGSLPSITEPSKTPPTRSPSFHSALPVKYLMLSLSSFLVPACAILSAS
ncbi:Uncharacterised protein [Streptococcus pneumoniae]|nr:Uncharacterised protein [Streptococcus pneumoniae]